MREGIDFSTSAHGKQGSNFAAPAYSCTRASAADKDYRMNHLALSHRANNVWMIGKSYEGFENLLQKGRL